MSEIGPPSAGSADETPGRPAEPEESFGTDRTAIPLPAASAQSAADQGVTTDPDALAGMESPTAPRPSGTWGEATGGAPFAAWQHPDFSGQAQKQHSSGGRRFIATTVATVVVVAAVLAGAGLGRIVWPEQPASTATATPNTSPPVIGSSGRATLPSGSGSPGSQSSPLGSGSTSNTATGIGAPSDISTIATKVDPALVDINTNLSYQHEQAAGTGMVIAASGLILTNNHVIDGATGISVTDVGNGKTYQASVVGYDRTDDIAVLKLVGAHGLRTISTSSGTVAVGQSVVGVGNAGGTGGTPSASGGSITALDQSITASDTGGGNAENLSGLIEVNAGIQPGDSGGALVDTSGDVIGMDTAASVNSGYQVTSSQAYAIPIATAVAVAKQIESGTASSTVHIGLTAFLGVSVQSSSGGSGSGFGSGLGAGNGSGASGAVVGTVLSGSAAQQAGLSQGDVITSVNGASVSSPTDLSTLLASDHPGDTVQLQWTNGSGQQQTASVNLASGPPA